MCGIVGFNWRDDALLATLVKRLRHRGPDASGKDYVKGVSLGHARLSIIDLSAKGKQPLTYKRGKRSYRITFNGEIYNYQSLRDELERLGHAFKTKTDTEVLLAAYDAWGSSFVERLNGMWAFCIHDEARQELFLSRDRFGIKPLYYVHDVKKGRFAFASEMQALVGTVIEPKVSQRGLREYFTFRFTLGETTLLQGVKKFLPAHSMLYDVKRERVKSYTRYYELPRHDAKEAGQSRSFSTSKKALRELLSKAVERRMVADVPVSAFLSGGVDSSTITVLAKEHNKRLHTFSMGFDTTNELPYARLVARHVQTKHFESSINADKLFAELDGMLSFMDEPVGDPGYLPMYALSRLVRQHNKVVLSGDGGDEVLTGYDRYKLFHYGWGLRHLALCSFGSDILGRLKAMRGKDEYEAFREVIRLFDDDELARLGLHAEERTARKEWRRAARVGATRVERAQAFDVYTLLPNDFFMKADKMSSAFGLEERVPFLDHELVEAAFALPLHHKLRWWQEKRVLKAAFKKLLPRVITKRRKHGFNVPVDHWFKGALGERLKKLLLKRSHDLYDKAYAYELLERIKKKGMSYKENFVLAQKLWSILIFEEWHARLCKRRLKKPSHFTRQRLERKT